MSLTIYRRGTIWHYRGTVNKRQLRGSCGTTEKAKAKRLTAQIEKNVWEDRFDGASATLTFAQAAMMYRAAEKSERFLAFVEDYWKDTLVSKIKPGLIRQGAMVVFPTQGGATRNRQFITPTQSIINYAASMELCPKISTPRFPAAKTERGYVTWPWVASFMEHSLPHMGALCCFMFLTAARIGEALRVTWDDVNFNEAEVLIKETKVFKERKAHMPPELVAAIANIPSARQPGARVFQYGCVSNARKVWNNTIDRAGIKYLSFHCCRHGFATAMLRAGVDPVTIAEHGGWSDVTQLFKTYGHARKRKDITNVLTQAQNQHNSDFNEDENILISKG